MVFIVSLSVVVSGDSGSVIPALPFRRTWDGEIDIPDTIFGKVRKCS
ncbi:hypothetical protein FRUB_03780 [Fimbriiglobus ruber]|uniref:Uncharacterized protein n=1 Tax=Fimbriiglobus ruber TaxID=1908690 RepID=A0A225DK04_9BACT|nr:hypothetical protein FRUB_03780 [Fimbriiglobus ruber]